MIPITQPGRYDLPMHVYHSQCCDGESLSASEAIILTNKTPAHLVAARAEEDDYSRKADMGKAIHTLVLEPFRSETAIQIIKAKDFRTDAAKADRDRALNEGKIPLLVADYELAKGAAERVLAHPMVQKLTKDAVAEQSFFAKDEKTGLWVKARPDLVTPAGRVIDLKSVGDCGYDFIQRRIYDGGWFQQAPWHAHVIQRVLGAPVRDFIWICVEQEAPHAIRIIRPVEASLVHGARLNERALALWADCCKRGVFPDYDIEVEEMGLADYAYYKLEADGVREENAAMKAVRLAEQHNASPFS